MIAILGAGRIGRGLALALADAGERVELAPGREAGAEEAAEVAGAARTVILAVPDDALTAVAGRLAASGAVIAGQVALHVSGLHDREALAPLAPGGAALGSLHPLQTIPDPTTAAERWRGAYAAVEGDPAAVVEAERLARLLGLTPLPLPAGAKPGYHAGAVIAANYTVVLAAVAARVAEAAGVPADVAGKIYLPMLQGAVDNLARMPAAEALTGPVRRGDVATVAGHLSALAPPERAFYARLGLEAVRLAEAAGLAAGPAGELRAMFQAALG